MLIIPAILVEEKD
jgi:small subunit ribosomal protein S7